MASPQQAVGRFIRSVVLLIVIVLAIALALMVWRAFPERLISIVLITVAVIGVLLAVLIPRTWTRAVFFNLAMIALILFGFEAWLGLSEPDTVAENTESKTQQIASQPTAESAPAAPESPVTASATEAAEITEKPSDEQDYAEKTNWVVEGAEWKGQYADRAHYYVDSALLGYSARPSNQSTSQRVIGERVLYDVVYNIDEHGLRVTPTTDNPAPKCVLFFGGSFTFGEGVPDADSMPYIAGNELGPEYRAWNFGFHGYGPHQMLAWLNSGRLDEVLKCESVTDVIYMAIDDHVPRAAGHREWDQYGPRFFLKDDGTVTQVGRFSDPVPEEYEQGCLSRFELDENKNVKSRLLSRLCKGEQHRRDKALYVGIIKSMAGQITARFPGARIHTIAWDDDVMKLIQEAGVPTDRSVNLLDSLGVDRTAVFIPEDGHPTGTAHRALAKYLVSKIRGS